MSYERFSPHFYFCEGGNHWHLITGTNYGASPPFISVPAGESIIDEAVDEEDPQDVVDAARLKEELSRLKLRHGKGRWGTLYAQLRWVDHLIPYWTDFINDKLKPNQTVIFGTFACDFVGRCLQETDGLDQHIVLRPRKVSEVVEVAISV
ncbi:MAG: hypothetical protein Q8P21_00095 [bacterium]|nr:hypothetical protein [bacterium]